MVNPTAPIPPAAVRAADELRALLRSGALPPLGLVDVGGGSRLAFELAIRATLNDLDRLTARARGGQVIEAHRWRLLGDDLLRLHGMAAQARASRSRE